MTNILDEIRAKLNENIDENTRQTGKRYFKEQVTLYGVKTATVEKIAKEFFNIIKTDKNKAEIFALCDQLWQSGYMEESFIACSWSYTLNKQFEEKDWQIFEKWVKNYVSNWASCDTLCNHTIGSFVEMYPQYINELKKWAKSGNRWVKRASAVTLIIPARKGLFLNDIFEIAAILLMDKDDMVQKGYGWMLKAASQAHEKEVFDFVISNKKVMPRTALRYAIEKMPPYLKSRAMEK
ncbi:MAG: DNA alkylation repair protein [Dehalococcoidales bacterium]|nr:DNA alkylation repair protein [Dehalococcoidales bacterium]